MKILNLEQNTPEWETFRRSRIGASDIALLMDGSEQEISDLLKEKRNLKEKYVTEAMKNGSRMEPEAIAWICGEKDNSKYKVCALHDEHDWLMASFDYLDMGTKTLVEAKCTKVVLDMATEHSKFNRWQWQVQTQLAVCGLDTGRILVYSPSKQTEHWVERDEKAIKELLKKGKWFYDIMVNFEELPFPQKILKKEDQDTIQWAQAVRKVDSSIKELDEEKKVLRDEGIANAQEESFECDGVRLQKILNKPKIDYEGACAAHNIDLSAFVIQPKIPFTWRLTVS